MFNSGKIWIKMDMAKGTVTTCDSLRILQKLARVMTYITHMHRTPWIQAASVWGTPETHTFGLHSTPTTTTTLQCHINLQAIIHGTWLCMVIFITISIIKKYLILVE